MKNKIILFQMAFITSIIGISFNICKAQQNKWNVGIIGGPSIISLKHGDYSEKNIHSPAIGYSGGISFQYNFKKYISIHSNMLFETKGAKLNGQATDINGNIIPRVKMYEKFDYLTLPLFVRASFGKKINFFVNTGPYIGYLTKAYFVLENYPERPSKYVPFEMTDGFYKVDLGIVAGLGLNIPIKQKIAISIEARNNFGLINIQKFGYTTQTNTANLMLGISYKFGERREKTI